MPNIDEIASGNPENILVKTARLLSNQRQLALTMSGQAATFTDADTCLAKILNIAPGDDIDGIADELLSTVINTCDLKNVTKMFEICTGRTYVSFLNEAQETVDQTLAKTTEPNAAAIAAALLNEAVARLAILKAPKSIVDEMSLTGKVYIQSGESWQIPVGSVINMIQTFEKTNDALVYLVVRTWDEEHACGKYLLFYVTHKDRNLWSKQKDALEKNQQVIALYQIGSNKFPCYNIKFSSNKGIISNISSETVPVDKT